jgi:hypothetical protein
MNTKANILLKLKQKKETNKKEKLASALRNNLLRRKNKTNENKI